MIRYVSAVVLLVLASFVTSAWPQAGKEGKEPKDAKDIDTSVTVDKDKGTVTIAARIAPRKLEYLSEIYPIEVIACYPHPKGKKAHETVVTIDAKPSDVHKALESLGLKPGTPVMGGKDEPQGPEVKLYLAVPGVGDEIRKLTMDKVLTAVGTNKPFPKDIKFRFTGSFMENVPNDPTKKEKVYAADTSGTLIVIFPVSNQTVLQTNLTMESEPILKLETNTKNLPPVGTKVKLIMQVVK